MRLKTDLRIKEKQLTTVQKSLEISEKEMEALEKECKKKIEDLEVEVSISKELWCVI